MTNSKQIMTGLEGNRQSSPRDSGPPPPASVDRNFC